MPERCLIAAAIVVLSFAAWATLREADAVLWVLP